MKEIKLTFKWDGKTVNKEVSGFQGNGCLSQTQFIDAALGTVQESEMKSDFFVPNPEGLDQQNEVHV